ncbi:MAG: SpoIIE family protein phosphatase [Chlamydiales bacterium]
MIKQSFTLRVLVISFFILALPLLIDSFIFFQDSYYHEIADAQLELRESANFLNFNLKEIEPVQQVFLREITYFFDLENLENLDQEKLSRQFSELVDLRRNFEILLLDVGKEDQYKLIASSMQNFTDQTVTSYLKLAHILKLGEGAFIRLIYSDQTGDSTPYIFTARVVHSKTGEPVGIILVTTEIKKQLESVMNMQRKNTQTQFAILSSDGIVFAATDRSLIGNYFDLISLERQREVIASKQMGMISLPQTPISLLETKDPPFFEFIFNDQIQIAYRAYLSDLGISVIAYSSKEEIFGKAMRDFLFIYSLYGMILVIGGGVAYWLSLWISRPLRQLFYLMEEVSRGNLNLRFEKTPLGFEINILGGIFNNTLVNLLENIQEVENERVRKEMYKRELAIGLKVQRSLLPSSLPKIQGGEVTGTYLSVLEVGGDLYSYMPLIKKNEETIMITVADAAGKGISPCLYSLSARSLLLTYATLVDDPGEALSRTNNAFIKGTGDTGMFVTMLAALYHTNSKILSYYSCGHVPPIIRRANGHLLTLEHSGMALGLRESQGYETDAVQLESGDIVIFYTKGLIESVNSHYQSFSEKRLKNCLQQRNWQTAQEVVDGLTAELQTFIGATLQEEVIIVALKID